MLLRTAPHSWAAFSRRGEAVFCVFHACLSCRSCICPSAQISRQENHLLYPKESSSTDTPGDLVPYLPGCMSLWTDIAMPIFDQVHPSQDFYYSASCTHYLILFHWILGRQDFDARLTRTFHLRKYIKTIMKKNSLGVKTSIRLSEVEESKEAAEQKQKWLVPPENSVFAGANVFHLSLVSDQSLFNGIHNCNKSHHWSVRKNIFCYTRSGYVSVPPLWAFSDLCCTMGFVSPAVLCPPLHSTNFLLLQPCCCLGKASPSPPPEGFPGSSLSRGKWWNCHPGTEPYPLKRAKSSSSNCDKEL